MNHWTIKIAQKILTRGGSRGHPAKLKSSNEFENFLEQIDLLRENPAKADLEFFLKFIFGKDQFRLGQREAVVRILQEKDTLVSFPTGSGKSLIFQLAAMLMPGTCLVIEPTLSLINDQIANLTAHGIGRTLSITSAISDSQELNRRLSTFADGQSHFCYVTPERLNTAQFRFALRRLSNEAGLCLIVIDEAHCVSEWGHDFRTAYLTAGRVLKNLVSEIRHVPLAALSATFSPTVLKEVVHALRMETGTDELRVRGVMFPKAKPMTTVVHCKSSDKLRLLAEILTRRLAALWPGDPQPVLSPRGTESRCGIIFCPHVEGPYGARRAAEYLREKGLVVDVYHGKPPLGIDSESWARQREETAERFKNNQTVLLAATKAFGLGIDKPNIRFTVHLGIPNSQEAWSQETGRAGRDGGPAYSWILASILNERRAIRLLDPAMSVETLIRELDSVHRNEEDDVVRALHFHVHAFRGLSRESEDIRQICHRLGNFSWPGVRLLSMPHQYQPIIEKALYRLLCLGLISDYTVRYRHKSEPDGQLGIPESPDMEYEVEIPAISPEIINRNLAAYVGGLGADPRWELPDSSLPFPDGAIESLLHAVYETVEQTRRKALSDMVLSCLGDALSVSGGQNAILVSCPPRTIPKTSPG